MLNLDEDAVICDLAETYQVYDWRSLPLTMVATFCCGLRANSRIMQKIRGEDYSTEEFLLMNISDALSILVWQNTKDGQKGINQPKMLTDLINKKKDNASFGFDSVEEFELMRQALLRRDTNG